MRLCQFIILWSLCAAALAAEQQGLPPVAPSLDANNETSPDQEAQVTITKQTEQTIEEYRVGGKLYMIKITPKHGRPYYLVDDRGDGKFARQESLDTGFRPPRWVLHKF